MFIKRFFEWLRLKEDLDRKSHKPPLVSEGNIWWCHLGENIGIETSGKGNEFKRPVIIYKKIADNFYMVIPTSTKIKTGSWFVPFIIKKIYNIACLHQVRVIDYRRIIFKLGELDDHDLKKNKKRIQEFIHASKRSTLKK